MHKSANRQDIGNHERKQALNFTEKAYAYLLIPGRRQIPQSDLDSVSD